MRRVSFALLISIVTACSHRPARYADRPPAEDVADDRPIAVPRRAPFIEAFYLSDVYLRRPIVDALDAARFPYARDVNSADEVPRSSWFSPVALEPAAFEREYAVDGPPLRPVRVESSRRGWTLADSRGKTYVLAGDRDGLRATSTASAVIASRLLRALGYRTAESWLVGRADLGIAPTEGPPGPGLTAIRWPLGVELGPTDMTYPRSDDPNDRIPHRDRRTLRALGVVAAWLDLGEIGPRRLVDVYVGQPGFGHVQHFVIGLEDALGAGRLGKSRATTTAAGTVRGSPLANLATLGLMRPKSRGEPSWRSLRVLSTKVSPSYQLADPYEPIDRLLPPDGYWAAKRLAAIPRELVEAAVAKAGIEDPEVASHVSRALEARRETLIAHWFDRVTPCEVEAMSGRTLILRDESRSRDASSRRYLVELVGDSGDELAPRHWAAEAAGEVEITLPELEADYVVVRVTVERGGVLARRPMEVHVAQDHGTPHVVGVRH